MGKRKRRNAHDDGESSSRSNNCETQFGMGAVLAHLRKPDLPLSLTSTATPERDDPPRPENCEHETGGEEDTQPWASVSRGRPAKKKQKLPQQPKNGASSYPSITHSPNSRLQTKTKIADLQSLVLYILADGTAPQWVSVRHHQSIRKVVVLMVPGLDQAMFEGDLSGEADKGDHKSQSPDDYYPTLLSKEKLPEPLKPLADVFAHLWPIKTPGDDKASRMHSPLYAMLTSPLPKSKEEKKGKGVRAPREEKTWQNQRTRITEFLATTDELRENQYALHPASLTTEQERAEELRRRQLTPELNFSGWVDTGVDDVKEGEVPEKDMEEGCVTAGREVLAMDCEMCKTDETDLTLTRVSLVGWDGAVVLDELVKPARPILDYLTPYSGITQAMLDPVTTTLAEVQQKLLKILHPRTLLVGQSLNADLTALKMTHPFIIDTSIIYPHPRGPPLKSSLKWLTQKYLGREIQKGHGTSGHSSIEDARACLDLVKQKCERGPLWGTSEASSESIFKRLSRTPGTSPGEGKTGAVVDWGQPERGAGGSAKVCIGCASDEEVVKGVDVAINGDDSGTVVSRGGVDFVWARLREVEALRGWSNANRSGTDEATTSPPPLPSPADLAAALTKAVEHILAIHTSLPPCTAFVVYSGSGDPRAMGRLQGVQQRFRREYQTRKWDELSVRWTDVEEQELRRAVGRARAGIGFVVVK
ncbi:MAG: hypothetical protein M1832_001298 [Thelocarpon impressellum]|nr:MAG: hypothetical protein M1832_001298 [Thelocarpon impressellum]